MPKVRVLVVDDSVVIRRILSDVLAEDPEIEVIGAAASGRMALTRIQQSTPDVVTLDLEMPDMDGFQTLAELKRISPGLPVIIFSSANERGAKMALDALAHGSSDFVPKPSESSREAAMAHLRRELLPRVRALGRRARPNRDVVAPARTRIPLGEQAAGVDIVAIGCSTGGPNALSALFAALPRQLPVPVVVVQHMPPLFTRLLAERLTATTRMPFYEAQPGQVLRPGHGYIAPGDFHMRLVRNTSTVSIVVEQTAPENSCRPSVDVLFRSVASIYGSRALGVVLTGMGHDGLRGCELLAEKGAHILVQDEATSVVWGMPGAVARAGLAHRVLPIPGIAEEIVAALATNERRAPAAASGA